VFGPAAMRLLAALITFRTSGRLRRAANMLDRLILETEQRRARCHSISQDWQRMRRGKRRRAVSTDLPIVVGDKHDTGGHGPAR
jgi:hypothetical protein